MEFRQAAKSPTEMVFGIIGPIGCNREAVIEALEKIARHFSYRTCVIKLSDIIKEHCDVPAPDDDQFARVSNLMTAGSELRRKTDNSILAKLAAAKILKTRAAQPDTRVIYMINSLKHPEEIEELRNIYGDGFYLFAIHASERNRDDFLRNECLIFEEEKRKKLIARDKDEDVGHGQSTSLAFHLADFFLAETADTRRIWNVVERFMDIIFGDPFKTPTFHEYSMFMAYAASVRSADMSRQVGAVITHGTDIISTGANECPSPGGGTYWPIYEPPTARIYDADGGRDYTNNKDRNGFEKEKIIEALKENLSVDAKNVLDKNIVKSGLNDLTEFGRVVHAEMDAILGCARRGVSAKGTVMFCSTHPCHNCAKHIVASGLSKVVYIEPYPKSKALELHRDSVSTTDDGDNKVLFIPFVGVGPRLYLNLFSLSLSSGEKVRRKKPSSYEKADWQRQGAVPRLKIFDTSYVRNERIVDEEAHEKINTIPRIKVNLDGSIATIT